MIILIIIVAKSRLHVGEKSINSILLSRYEKTRKGSANIWWWREHTSEIKEFPQRFRNFQTTPSRAWKKEPNESESTVIKLNFKGIFSRPSIYTFSDTCNFNRERGFLRHSIHTPGREELLSCECRSKKPLIYRFYHFFPIFSCGKKWIELRSFVL